MGFVFGSQANIRKCSENDPVIEKVPYKISYVILRATVGAEIIHELLFLSVNDLFTMTIAYLKNTIRILTKVLIFLKC
jgi:hypothetical protein